MQPLGGSPNKEWSQAEPTSPYRTIVIENRVSKGGGNRRPVSSRSPGCNSGLQASMLHVCGHLYSVRGPVSRAAASMEKSRKFGQGGGRELSHFNTDTGNSPKELVNRQLRMRETTHVWGNPSTPFPPDLHTTVAPSRIHLQKTCPTSFANSVTANLTLSLHCPLSTASRCPQLPDCR